MRVGCFEIEELSPGRWKVLNTLTTIAHITYGTEAEVSEQARLQTVSWEQKFDHNASVKGQRGSAWRRRANNEVRAILTEREPVKEPAS